MGLTILVGAVVVIGLAALLLTPRAKTGPARPALSASAMACAGAGAGLVAVVLSLVPAVPWVAVFGTSAFAAVSVAALWRLVVLDRSSPWMTPSQRRIRVVASTIGLAWLGVVLGLLLWIAALLLRESRSP